MGRIASSQVASSPTAGKQIASSQVASLLELPHQLVGSLGASLPGHWPRVRWERASQVAGSELIGCELAS
ncbi:UNVERIFIED_CONTAM: hypothetical protein Sradi_6891200 [Sesamum radiatum]|uniref:Uncharacterized protein n=1 Tax=Sesamum radiatum TaxID=300843 RepID=A0AAW2JL67_SESRA